MDCPRQDCDGEVLMQEKVHEFWSFNLDGDDIERVERKRSEREDRQVFFCDNCTATWTYPDLKLHQGAI